MKIQRITRSAPMMLFILIFAISISLAPVKALAEQPPVGLGSTEGYAVLAGSTITNTGTTIINGSAGGNVGLHPGTIFTGQTNTTISGTVHLADAAANTAKNDLVIAYNDAVGRTPVTRIPSELGGTTLTPGTYDSADGTFEITGTLTLDAKGDPEGVFVFKSASTLKTASGSNINLINSARYCRTFWSVGSSATLGTNSHFVGHILAMISITANTGASVQGQLLARNGAVTLDSNTITNGICEVAATPTPTPAVTIVPTPVVTVVPTPVLGMPVIKITKTANPMKITTGRGLVTYKYKVTNPGSLPLGQIIVTDDKISQIKYVSGDTNLDNLLQADETWLYEAKTTLTKTTVNTGTVIASANSIIVTDTDVAKVIVTRKTVTGGQLPKTGTPFYDMLFVGMALILVGTLIWIGKRKHEGI